MSLLKRIGFYLIGLSIGLVFLSVFFKKKSEQTGVSFCYLPNCRTLKDMRSKPIQYSDAVQKLLENSALDSLDISYFLNSGEVDFGRSDTQSTPCKTYYIEGVVKEIPQVLKVKNCPDSIEIVDLEP